MYGDKNDLLTSRIFSTEVGVRPAEPCSVSVVATHQLLTNIFAFISLTIITNPKHRFVSGALITERDLQTLERCNRENIKALERIVGVDRNGNEIHDLMKDTVSELRAAGDVWAEHVLEVSSQDKRFDPSSVIYSSRHLFFPAECKGIHNVLCIHRCDGYSWLSTHYGHRLRSRCHWRSGFLHHSFL